MSPARWARAQQDEIASDGALRCYGAMLAAGQVLTAWWLWSHGVGELLQRGTEPLCWPFFPDCHVARVLTAREIDTVVAGAALVSSLAGIAFLRWPRAGWWLLLAGEALKLAIVAQDFRLRANQHYMAFFALATFLFLPEKRRVVRYTVMLFYLWAGVLKLDPEWLSGAALYRPPWFFTGAMLPFACWYVVVLELAVVWALLARRPWLFWPALLQFAVFHAFSWPIVGAFYPLLMACLLAIFPLCRLIPIDERPPFRHERWTTWAFIAGFSILQLAPLSFGGDAALTGEGRLFSLHMFDARIQCEARARVHDAKSTTISDIDLKMALPTRIACDPLVYFDRARTLCRQIAQGGLDLDLSLRSRRTTVPELRPVIATSDFCARNLSYSVWRSNDWILK